MHLENGDYFSYESLVDNFIGKVIMIGDAVTTYYEISVLDNTAKPQEIGTVWMKHAHKISKKTMREKILSECASRLAFADEQILKFTEIKKQLMKVIPKYVKLSN